MLHAKLESMIAAKALRAGSKMRIKHLASVGEKVNKVYICDPGIVWWRPYHNVSSYGESVGHSLVSLCVRSFLFCHLDCGTGRGEGFSKEGSKATDETKSGQDARDRVGALISP